MPNILDSGNYKQEIHEKTNAIIDFSAVWCGPCKRMEPLFKNAETFIKEAGIELDFFKVDVDDSEDIATDYNIESMPTLVLIKNGKIVERSSGFMDCDSILIMIGRHFDLPQQKTKVASKHAVNPSQNTNVSKGGSSKTETT